MAKNSLEKKIKKVLEERRIPPSERAWTAIETELGAEAKAGSKWTWGYGIAAGFIGAILISVFLITRQGTDAVPAVEVVKSTGGVNEVLVPDLQLGGPQKYAGKEPAAEAEENTITDGQTAEISIPENEELSVHTDIPEEKSEVKVKSVVPQEGVDQKVAEIIAQVSIMESTGEVVQDEVIDSLLRTAQDQLLKGQVGVPPASVDALALLSDVEDELNRSFRDQLFDKLKESYLKVRTAVVYRND